jgi:outer membrane protein
MKHAIVLTLAGAVTLSAAAFSGETDSLSLDAAVRLAVDRSIVLRQTDAQVRAAEARIAQSESDFLPKVQLAADYTRLGPIPAFAFPGFGEIPLAPEYSVSTKVVATQTLIDLGLRSAKVEASTRASLVAAAARRSIRSALQLQVTQGFYTVMLLERSVTVQDRQIESLRQHLDITRKRVESGSATDFDALTTDVRVAQAENVRIDLLRALSDQRISLTRLLGLAWDSPALLRGSFAETVPAERLDTLIDEASRTRPDLLAARDAVDAAKAQEHAAARENDPTLRLHAAYGLNNGFEPNIYATRGNWSAGISLDVPIFDGNRTRSKTEEMTALREAVEERYRDLARTAEAEVRQAIEGVESAKSKVYSTDMQVRQAEAAVANARVRYDSGAGTNLDLLDAETNVAAARLQQLQAHYQLTMAAAVLDAAAGRFGR